MMLYNGWIISKVTTSRNPYWKAVKSGNKLVAMTFRALLKRIDKKS